MTADNTGEASYPMRRWVFEDTPGRYDIDLGSSCMAYVDLSRIPVPTTLRLDYGTDRGTAELRSRIAELYQGDPDSVVVAHGAGEALSLLFSTLLRPGHQVISFRPGWVPSFELPAHLGCQVDVLPYGPDMAVPVEQVHAVAGPELRLIYLNSPCNPTGQRVSEAVLRPLVDLVSASGGYLVLDEEYALDLSDSPATRDDRVVSVSGLSKVYGVPGLRIGWMYGPQEVLAASTAHKYLTSISNSVLCEALACQVLADRDSYLRTYHRTVNPCRELVERWAARHSDAVRLIPPDGTPFAWLELTTGEPSLTLCRRALDVGVLLFPGETLGSSRGFRLGFARGAAEVAEGLRRLEQVLRPATVQV